MRRRAHNNHGVQATPGCACLLFVSQCWSAPDAERSDSEYVRVRLSQHNQVVSVWIQVETR